MALGDVLARTETVDPSDRPNAEFEYVDVSSVSNETFDIQTTQRLKGKDAPSRARRLIRANDVLFATVRPTLQRIAVVPPELDGQVCSTGYYVMRPKEVLDHRWLFYSLFTRSFMGAMQALQKGASYPAVNDSDVRRQQIPVPSLQEQHRIVAILDEAFAAIATAKANAEKNLQNARAVFEASLSQAFSATSCGWVTAAIGEHIRFIDYRGKTPVKTDAGLRLITAKNVKMGYVQREPMEFVEPKSYDGWMSRGIPKTGDVLFTTEAPLANVAQLDTDEKVVFAQRIIIMQPDAQNLDSTFVKYLLMSAPVQARIRAQGTGATVQGIKASLLKGIKIDFPPSLREQRTLAARLNALSAAIEQLEVVYDRKLAAIDDLKRSALHHAFTGQLTGGAIPAIATLGD